MNDRSFVTERGDDLMVDRVTYDGLTDQSHPERITVLDGRLRRSVFSVPLYSPVEIKRLLRSVGFGDVNRWPGRRTVRPLWRTPCRRGHEMNVEQTLVWVDQTKASSMTTSVY